MSVFLDPALKAYPEAHAGVREYFAARRERVVEEKGERVGTVVKVVADAWDRRELRRLIVFSRARVWAYCPEGGSVLPASPGEHAWVDAGSNFFRLEYRPEPTWVGDHRMPTKKEADGWSPKCWVRVRDIPQLPPALQRAWLAPKWKERLVQAIGSKARDRLDDDGMLSLFDAWELLDAGDSVQACVGGWPLKYVRRSYLEWLVMDGRFERRLRMKRAYRNREGLWAHEPAGEGEPGWDVHDEDHMPTAAEVPGQVNVLRDAILRFLATQVRVVKCAETGIERVLYHDEPAFDDDPELVNREGFCTWGYWDQQDRFVASGSSKPVKWPLHEMALWINSDHRYRWTRTDEDPTWRGARLGLVENGGTGRLRLQDLWEPSRAEDPGRTEVRLPRRLKEEWLKGRLAEVPRQYVVRVDYEEPRPVRSPEEAFRLSFEASERLERLAQGAHGDGPALDAEEREEGLHQVLDIFQKYCGSWGPLLEEFYPTAARGLDVPGRCQAAWAALGGVAGDEPRSDEPLSLSLEWLAWRALDELERFVRRSRRQLLVQAGEAVRRGRQEDRLRRSLTDEGPADRHGVAEALAEAATAGRWQAAYVEALEVAYGQYLSEGRTGLTVERGVAVEA
jgi:hypothetical protein